MDASCQAVSSDTLVVVAVGFLRRSREEARTSLHSAAAMTTGTAPTPSGDPATVAMLHAFTYKTRESGLSLLVLFNTFFWGKPVEELE